MVTLLLAVGSFQNVPMIPFLLYQHSHLVFPKGMKELVIHPVSRIGKQ